MLLKRLKLVNYGGIYNGMGLNEIEIDFTRCQHRIILIKGDNGTGKSTIESALKPLPDDNSSFIFGKDAMKEIEYIDEFTNVIYRIRFIHEYKGSSRTTKGYISKGLSDATMVELNPSGNITGCKDIIYEELQLDPNYITLSQLSATKRGIADLKPAERKRYVNAILSATDVYNDMYKTLSKKASAYKGMVQSVVAKLDTIGNVTQLEQNIKILDQRIQEAENMIEQYTEIMNKEKGMLYSIDPDSKLRERIEYLTNTIKEYKAKRDKTSDELKKIYAKMPILVTRDITQDNINEINTMLLELNNRATSIKSRISAIIESRICDSDELQVKTAKLKSINSSGSLSEIKKMKQSLLDSKQKIEARWNSVININVITADEFMSIYNVILEMIDILSTRNIPVGDIDYEYRMTLQRIKEIDEEIDKYINDSTKISAMEDKVYILEQRPDNCNNDTCPFIADAIKAKAILDNLLESRKGYKKSISKLNEEKEQLQSYIEVLDAYKYLEKLYKINQRILRSFRIGFDDFVTCINTLKYNSSQIRSILQSVLEYTNDIEEYKSISKTLDDIESKFHALSSQEDFINMITSDIDRLQKQIENDNITIANLNTELETIQIEYTKQSNLLEIYIAVIEKRSAFREQEDAIRILQEEIDTNKANIERVQKINSDIEKLTTNISQLKEQLKPLKQEREALSHKLAISVEYDKELREYEAMYTKIDTLKYYCSPTTGIQLLFANMYLNKILDNVNRILCNLFGGIFALLPLVITETEFKIPVAVNGGLNHDDITSMSSAQVSLISMIISIALLSQTSTKLNIIVGDEIDAPFDSENRREFITILYQLMSLVNSSQCVLISHNSEIPINECDVILLKSDNDIVNDGNIIWSYR